MTIREFFEMLQGYYNGEYNEIQGAILLKKVEHFTEDELGELLAQIIKDNSLKWKALPGVTEINEATMKLRQKVGKSTFGMKPSTTRIEMRGKMITENEKSNVLKLFKEWKGLE